MRAVLIGRFQPFHLGHLDLAREGLSISGRLLVVLGSSGAPSDLRNPWDVQEREAMIRRCLPGADLAFAGVPDSAYDLEDWVARVTRSVESACHPGERPVLVGHSKDETSFYLRHFPRWDYREFPLFREGLGATQLRKRYLQAGAGAVADRVPPGVADWLRGWQDSAGYLRLQEDARAVEALPGEALREELLVCLDDAGCLVRCRRAAPGSGFLELPGGLVAPGADPDALRDRLREVLAPEAVIFGQTLFDGPGRDVRGKVASRVTLYRTAGTIPVPEGCVRVPADAWDTLRERFFGDHGRILGYAVGKAEEESCSG